MALQDRFPAYKRVIATAGVENAQIAATTINFWVSAINAYETELV